MLNLRVLLIPFLLCVHASLSLADPVDDFVMSEMQRQGILGLSVGIIRNGKVLKAQGYGIANVEHQVPAKRETVYQLGSVSKQFTATAVMLLVQDRKLRVDDSIAKHLKGAPIKWEGVTIRDLLQHTAGIWDRNFFGDVVDMHKDLSDDELLSAIFSLDPMVAPGYSRAYSNTGYMLLGLLVTKLSGMPYGDFLRQRVFMPAGMTTARLIDELDIVPNRAAGYRRVNGQLQNQEWVAPTWNRTGDGNLYMTVDDLIKWDQALDSGVVLPKSAIEEMWTPVKTRDGSISEYGFGWSLEGIPRHRRVWHSGAWQGFTSRVERFRDDGLTVIVMTNLGYPEAKTGALTSGIASMYLK